MFIGTGFIRIAADSVVGIGPVNIRVNTDCTTGCSSLKSCSQHRSRSLFISAQSFLGRQTVNWFPLYRRSLFSV